jgi:hypothetical protein
MAETVNLKKSYSVLNEALVKLFDESGVRRAFTVPYLEGQEAKDHINAVGQAAQQVGGLTKNLIMSAHHSSGKGFGSGDGHTVGHPAEKLRQTMIPAKDENAQAAIAAAQKCINNFKFLLGDDNPTVQTAQGQLNLVKPTSGAGMSLFDFGALLINLMFKPTQEIARAHSGQKKGGHAAHLRGPETESPQNPQGGGQEAAGEAQGGEGAPESQEAASAAPAASSESATAPPAQG